MKIDSCCIARQWRLYNMYHVFMHCFCPMMCNAVFLSRIECRLLLCYALQLAASTFIDSQGILSPKSFMEKVKKNFLWHKNRRCKVNHGLNLKKREEIFMWSWIGVKEALYCISICMIELQQTSWVNQCLCRGEESLSIEKWRQSYSICILITVARAKFNCVL